MNGEIMQVESFFKYLESCVSKDGTLLDDVKISVDERLETFGEVNILFNVSNVGLGVKRELYEGVVLQTVPDGAGTLGMRRDVIHILTVVEIKPIQSICGVTKMIDQ